MHAYQTRASTGLHVCPIASEVSLANVHRASVDNVAKTVSDSFSLSNDLSSFLHEGDPCASQPCTNGGSCVRDNAGFRCVCPPGYSGARCEIRDACQSNPCMNGATCRPSGSGGYQCVCPPGYSGPRCETRERIEPIREGKYPRESRTLIRRSRRCVHTQSLSQRCFVRVQ